MKFLPLIFKNVFRKKTRTILTLVSIILPLLVVCIMGSFLASLDRPDPGAARGMFRIVTRHKVGLTSFLPVTYEEKVRQLPGVKAATNFNWFGGKFRDGSASTFFARFAVDPETFLEVFDDATIVEGTKADWLADRTGVIVAKSLAENYGWKLGDKFTLLGDIYPANVELTVRGIYTPPAGNGPAVFFNRKYLEEAVPWFKGTLGTVWAKAESAAAAERLAVEIDAMFENSSYPTKTESEKAFQLGFVQMLGNVKLLMGSLCVAIVFVIVLIAANTMAMTARERVTEVAVFRTLGFQKSTILGLILGESVLLALVGGLLGVGIFAGTAPALKSLLLKGPMAGFAEAFAGSPGILLMGFGIAFGIGVVAGIVPAISSAQRSITDGLRRVA